MIRARIEALVRSWTGDNGDPPDTDYQRGYMAACAEHARGLTQILAEEEGGWRPIAEIALDQSVWRFRLGDQEGFVRATAPGDAPWDNEVRYAVVIISDHGRFALTLGRQELSEALVAPLPPPPGARP